MKAFKVFINAFEAPQRSVKIKNYVNFLSSSGIRTERINSTLISNSMHFLKLSAIYHILATSLVIFFSYNRRKK